MSYRNRWSVLVLGIALLLITLAAWASPTGAQQPRPPAPPTRPDRKTTSTESAAVERRLTDAVRRAPDSFDAQYQLASFYVQKGRLDAALPHLRRACAIDPTHYDSGHDLALALNMLLPLAIGLGLTTRNPLMRLLFLAGAAAMGAAVYITYSRGGLVALVAVGVYMLAKMGPRYPVVALLIALVAVGLVVFGPGRNEHRTSREKHRTNTLAGLCLQPGAWDKTQGELDDVKISDVTMHDGVKPLGEIKLMKADSESQVDHSDEIKKKYAEYFGL